MRGDSTQEQYQRVIRSMAARQFDHFADQINSGVDLQDIAQPYMQTMADVLELNPGQIDLYDHTIRQALSGFHRSGFDANGPKTGSNKSNKKQGGSQMSGGPMTMTEFEDYLRQDKRWQFTQSARDQATEYAVRLGEAFGVL